MRAARLGLFAVVLGVAAIVGCADAEPPGRDPRPSAQAASPGKRPVSENIIAFLSKARASHHNADLFEAKGDLERAAAAIRAITDGPRPGDPRAGVAAEVREVLADAYARLADLESRRGEFDAALAAVDAGLLLAVDVTHFRGHLFETRGLVFERRMKRFESEGNEAKAAADRQAALTAFETAIAIQDEVITKLLPDPSPAVTASSSASATPR